MKYVFANWKMYLDFSESCVFANRLLGAAFDASQVKLAVFPTYLAIPDLVKIFADTSIAVGAQTCAWTPKGAYTGAVSAFLLKEAGCEYVLVGHSERRYIFGETGEDVRKKLAAALDAGLTPVLCIGETEADKNEGRTEYRLKKQLWQALNGLPLDQSRLIIAYEPVWAIGTGRPCRPADADDVIGWIRLEIKQYIKGAVPLLYGGSVEAENVVDYVSRATIDGVLVGGAASKFETFAPLIRAVESR